MNGKHIIRMGNHYVRRAKTEGTSINIILVKELKYANLMNLEGAERLKEKIGGEIVKLKVEMEIVE